ncbi:hypothetical protein SAMN02799637_04697 [Ralstonia sp. UNCCL144]|jgi:hypothetical protein|nr:hypothetical protein SAMN02799637_04697 [Ralstonia sp. UNCCL144]
MVMKRQMSFAEVEGAGKKRVTKRQRFLAKMEKAVPWARLVSAIKPYYPRGERGRPPIGLERMLRIYFPQQWYSLSDEGPERVRSGMLPSSAARSRRCAMVRSRTCRLRRRGPRLRFGRGSKHPFHVIKNLFGHRKVRYKGLAKNTAQLFSLFGLANLVLARRQLLTSPGSIAS